MNNVFVDQRSALEFCAHRGEVLRLSKEIDPVYEVAAITKSFEGGPVLIFDRIKGYPGWKAVCNLMSRRERIAGFLEVTEQELPQRIGEAVFHPTPPQVIDNARCQEVVIDWGIDILGYYQLSNRLLLILGQ